jgi:hypothetical protein
MKTKVDTWTPESLKRRESKIDPSPPYQRGPVWSEAKMQLLIDSMLREIDIPKIYLRERDKGTHAYEIIDGQQRFRSILEYMKGQYSLAKDSDPVDGYQIAGATFSDLALPMQDKFCGANLHVVVISQATNDEIEEMFLRLNNGETLRAAEKRNAISGKIRDCVKSLADHRFFNSVAFKNTRFSYDAVAAQMLLLELEGGPCNIRDGALKKMYIERKDSGVPPKTDKKVKKVLHFLSRAFPHVTPELKKVNVASLYLLVSALMEQYAISDKEETFGKWFLGFDGKLKVEMEKPEDQRNTELIAYQKATSQATNDVDSVKIRHETLLTSYLLYDSELEQLDPKRHFNDYQRIAIFRNDKGVCRKCGREVKYNDEYHADHVIPYIRGGKTTVANGQLLCRACNLKKGAQ